MQKAVVVKPPEWIFMAIIARNDKFKGHRGQNFAQFASKMAKKLIIFSNIPFPSQS